MSRGVNPPIQQAALDVAQTMEPKLIDLLGVLEKVVQEEKEAITNGISPYDSTNNLKIVFQDYYHSKEAVSLLKQIAKTGLNSMRPTDLVELLNYGYTVCHHDYPPLQPLKDFVSRYKTDIFYAAVRTARNNAGEEHRQREEACENILRQLPDYKIRFEGLMRF